MNNSQANSAATIDGAIAPNWFQELIEHSHQTRRLANGCYPCGSALYEGREHGATCLRRAVAEALLGWLS